MINKDRFSIQLNSFLDPVELDKLTIRLVCLCFSKKQKDILVDKYSGLSSYVNYVVSIIGKKYERENKIAA